MSSDHVGSALKILACTHPTVALALRAHLDALEARAGELGAQNAGLEAERDTWHQCAEERQLAAQAQMADKHSLVTERDALKAELNRLKANHSMPSNGSGPVAEDEAVLRRALSRIGTEEVGLLDFRLHSLAEKARGFERLQRIVAYIQECEGGPSLLTEAGTLAEDRNDDVRLELIEARQEMCVLPSGFGSLKAQGDGFAKIHSLLFVSLSSFLENHPSHVRRDHHGWILGWDLLEALHAALSSAPVSSLPTASESSRQVSEDEAWVTAAIENRLVQHWMAQPDYNRSADEARRRALSAFSRIADRARSCEAAERLLRNADATATTAQQREQAAVADNAALVGQLRYVVDNIPAAHWNPAPVRAVLSQPHPGAALLAKHPKVFVPLLTAGVQLQQALAREPEDTAEYAESMSSARDAFARALQQAQRAAPLSTLPPDSHSSPIQEK